MESDESLTTERGNDEKKLRREKEMVRQLSQKEIMSRDERESETLCIIQT